jgi:hypothetical protein
MSVTRIACLVTALVSGAWGLLLITSFAVAPMPEITPVVIGGYFVYVCWAICFRLTPSAVRHAYCAFALMVLMAVPRPENPLNPGPWAGWHTLAFAALVIVLLWGFRPTTDLLNRQLFGRGELEV